MPQTIRLLSTYNGNPPGTIVLVDDAIAAQLLAGGVNATTDLSGGRRTFRPPETGRAQIDRQVAKSIMFMGDSITAPGRRLTSVPEDLHVQTLSPAFTNINTAGFLIVDMLVAQKCPAGSGTLRYYAAEQAISWQAPSDVEGAHIPVPVVGDYVFPSGTSGYEVYLSVIPRNKPATDKSDVIAIASAQTYGTNGAVGLHCYTGLAQALLDVPFSRVLTYAVGGSKAADWVNSTQWVERYTDLTSIYLGTNDITDIASARQCLADIESIAKRRIAIGSAVILWAVLPASTRPVSANIAVIWYNTEIRKLAQKYNAELVDMWSYAVQATSATGQPVAALYKDGLHPNAALHYTIYKRALAQILRKYASTNSNTNQFAGIPYDATTAPWGNLLANALMSGVAGTKGTGVTGEVPDGWNVSRNGSNLTAVAKAPASASPKVRTDGKQGAWLTLNIDNSAGVNNEFLRVGFAAFVTASKYSPGDRLQGEGDIQISGNGIQNVIVQITATAAAGGTKAGYGPVGSAELTAPLGSLDGDTWTIPFKTSLLTLDAGDTNVTMTAIVYMRAGGIAILDVGQTWNLHKVAS